MLYIYMLARTTRSIFNTWYLCPNHAYQAFHFSKKYAMKVERYAYEFHNA